MEPSRLRRLTGDWRTAAAAAAVLAVLVPLSPPAAASSSAERAIHVKFREGALVRLRGGELRSIGKDDLRGVRSALAGVPALRLERLFTQPEGALARDRRALERRSGRRLPDLNLWFRARVPEAEADEVAAALRRLRIVETAYVEPLAAPPPPVTPSFVAQQGYRGPAPAGIDAGATTGVAGARGGNVKVVDIEYSWNVNHEDLSKARAPGALIPNGTPSDPFSDDNHGTAVLGEIAGDDNAFGITGLVPDVAIGMVNAANTAGYQLANAINVARQNMSPGDVMLIEQQTPGANGGCNATGQTGCVAVEWFQGYYDAIKTATAAGIIVVEAAGNGNQNLDGAEYGSPFPAGRSDSGAIIVGAGGAPGCSTTPRSRLGFSTHGSRVNVQGWGQCVTTTGYGGLQGGPDRNIWYTNGFSGTSSASPIVASAAASLSSAREAINPGAPLTSAEARTILMETGTPQDTTSPGVLAGNIGPLPNLAAALPRITGGAPLNDAFASGQTLALASGSVAGSNVGATKEAGEPNHGGSAGGKSVWYRWTAPADGLLTVTTAGSIDTGTTPLDTLLAVYTGSAVNALTLPGPPWQNDDADGAVTSRVGPLSVTAGTTYRIAVDGYDDTGTPANAADGSVSLNWTFVPPNDAFASSAELATPSGTTGGSNIGATKEAGEPNHHGNTGGKSVWYRWTAPANGQLTVRTAGSMTEEGDVLDTLLAVYTGSAVGALAGVASNDDSDGALTSRVGPFAVTAGTTYRIAVDGYNGTGIPAEAADGTIDLEWTFASGLGAPTGVTAVAGSGQATVSWSPPASDGGSPITGYTVTPYAGGAPQAPTVVGNVTSTPVTGLTCGTEYTFTVKATNAGGTGPESAASNAVTLPCEPDTTVAGPSGTWVRPTATFTLGSDVGGATFECRVNGGAWSACASPVTRSVYPGRSVLEFRAVAAGTPDPSPATRELRVVRPLVVDWDGNGKANVGVWRPAVGGWYVEGSPTGYFGLNGDVPVPGQWDGDPAPDRAIWRPESGGWYVEGSASDWFGLATDVPVPGQWDADPETDRAVWRPAVGGWYVQGQATSYFGATGDVPVPGDYDADPALDRAVFRPSNGGWYVEGSPTVFHGVNGDIPVPADWNGDGKTDIAVFRPSNAGWYLRNISTTFFGAAGDVPLAGDYDADPAVDRVVWRPATGAWYVDTVPALTYFGAATDVP